MMHSMSESVRQKRRHSPIAQEVFTLRLREHLEEVRKRSLGLSRLMMSLKFRHSGRGHRAEYKGKQVVICAGRHSKSDLAVAAGRPRVACVAVQRRQWRADCASARKDCGSPISTQQLFHRRQRDAPSCAPPTPRNSAALADGGGPTAGCIRCRPPPPTALRSSPAGWSVVRRC